MLDELETRMERETLRYAVSRSIFCPTCKGILDIQRAVLVYNARAKGAGIACASCFDGMCDELQTKTDCQSRADVLALMVKGGIEITDGRDNG